MSSVAGPLRRAQPRNDSPRSAAPLPALPSHRKHVDLTRRIGTPHQDAVVDLAIDNLYREVREQREEELRAAASADGEFRAEVERIARELEAGETWPA